MRSHRARAATQAACLAIAAAFSTAQATPALAPQRGVAFSLLSSIKQDPARARQRDMSRRELLLRNNGATPDDPENPQRTRAIVEQIKQDFKRIQIVRNEMVHAISASKPLDYKFISDETGEIKKRASRLQTHLMLYNPESDEKTRKEQAEFNGEQMKGVLVTLCNLIISFTENPVLKNPGTVDLKQSAKARNDLQTIIELSGNIKKSADRLKK